tara:strand:- start:43 stop:600 length:558 start_codon:yes stop_codon:yes gene_type:complete
LNKLIIFYPGTGGNHLGNIIGASMSCQNCHSFETLKEYYLQDNQDAHSQIHNFNLHKSITNNLYKEKNNLWTSHWFAVWQTLFEDEGKFRELTAHLHVLVLVSNAFTLSQRYNDTKILCPDDIKYQYTKQYTKQCFPNWQVSAIDFDVLTKPIETIQAHLQDTPFHIDTKQAGPLHEKWLKKVFK